MSNNLTQFRELTKQWFANMKREPFIPGKTHIPLSATTYGWEEASEAIESLLTTWVTMGDKVKRFEETWANYIGVPHAIMVNSGSSANLIALSVLANPATPNGIRPGDEVITPAVTWATTVFPIVNVGAVPVLVDIDLDTLNVHVAEMEKAISHRTRAIMVVHLIGNPCAMKPITDLARKHNLFLIEDSCESQGAEVDDQKVGSFGDLATFSFHFTHHITTIEGGMVVTSNEKYAELAKALRAFGWIRDLRNKAVVAQKYRHIDPKFLFTDMGYNLRPTDIQGAFGIHQIKKLEGFIQRRRENARYWTENLRKYSEYLHLHEERPGTRHAWHHYPVTVLPQAPFTREALVQFLNSKGLETRPIMTGNMAEQPVMKLFKHRVVGDLPNSRLVHRQSFLFGVHQGIGPEEREAVLGYFREFMEGIRRAQ